MNKLLPLVKITSMTSLEIAEVTGKNHGHVLRDIRNMIKNLNANQENIDFVYDSEKKLKSLKYISLPVDVANIMLDKYKGLSRVPNRLQEEAALKTIEQLLKITLIRQFQCNRFRIDGYDPINNIAYEIDEPHHESTRLDDLQRQRDIEKILKCTFVRIKL